MLFLTTSNKYFFIEVIETLFRVDLSDIIENRILRQDEQSHFNTFGT